MRRNISIRDQSKSIVDTAPRRSGSAQLWPRSDTRQVSFDIVLSELGSGLTPCTYPTSHVTRILQALQTPTQVPRRSSSTLLHAYD